MAVAALVAVAPLAELLVVSALPTVRDVAVLETLQFEVSDPELDESAEQVAAGAMEIAEDPEQVAPPIAAACASTTIGRVAVDVAAAPPIEVAHVDTATDVETDAVPEACAAAAVVWLEVVAPAHVTELVEVAVVAFDDEGAAEQIAPETKVAETVPETESCDREAVPPLAVAWAAYTTSANATATAPAWAAELPAAVHPEDDELVALPPAVASVVSDAAPP